MVGVEDERLLVLHLLHGAVEAVQRGLVVGAADPAVGGTELELADLRRGPHGVERGEQGGRVDAVADRVVGGGHGGCVSSGGCRRVATRATVRMRPSPNLPPSASRPARRAEGSGKAAASGSSPSAHDPSENRCTRCDVRPRPRRAPRPPRRAPTDRRGAAACSRPPRRARHRRRSTAMSVAVVSSAGPRRDARGVTAMAPFVVGYAPFALAVGAVVAGHGDRLAGWTGSWLIYGGSAHLSTLRTLDRPGCCWRSWRARSSTPACHLQHVAGRPLVDPAHLVPPRRRTADHRPDVGADRRAAVTPARRRRPSGASSWPPASPSASGGRR